MEDETLTHYESLKLLMEYLEDKPHLQQDLYCGSVLVMPFSEERWHRCIDELGAFTKRDGGTTLDADRMFGTVKLYVAVQKRLTCERILTGTETVTTETYPEGVTPLVTETEQDVYEWVCPDNWKENA